jgi:kynureninase
MLGGVNYYTGQVFEMGKITAFAKSLSPDIMVGYDLAHAAGNVELFLHDWQVDFACWCGYKYLNSGPGGSSGVFVHEKHCENSSLPRLSGWWGNDEETRFQMQKGFYPQPGAAGWQMSNAQILPMAAHRASLAIFEEAGMNRLRKKSELLTGYLEFLLCNGKRKDFTIITPADPMARGCQLSILMHGNGRQTFDRLTENNVIADWREPDLAAGKEGVIRVAPVPLYNSFEEVFRFAEIFHGA